MLAEVGEGGGEGEVDTSVHICWGGGDEELDTSAHAGWGRG